MNAQKVVFLAHDPGGLDVTRPVAERMIQNGMDAVFHCIGAAAKLCPQYASSEEEVLELIDLDDTIAVLVCGTSWGNDFELKAIEKCRHREIETVVLLDFWANYANRFQKGTGEFIYPDHYVVMDHLAFREAEESGVPSQILRVLGQPGLDQWVELGEITTPSGSFDHLRVLFLSQPLSAIYGSSLGYTEQQVIEDILAILRKDLGDELRIKFHPKDQDSLRKIYEEFKVEGELSELFLHYDVIIGMSTMALLHAALFGKSVLSYQPNLRMEDMSITNKLGITQPLNSLEDLRHTLDQLRDGMKGGGMAGLRLNNEELIWMDGVSTVRILEFIKGLLDQ